MPRGDKSAYTAKQKRQARDIEKSYESRGVSEKQASRRAWATVNKLSGGGKKSGSGRKSAARKSASKTAKKSAAKKSAKSSAGKTATRKSSAKKASGNNVASKTKATHATKPAHRKRTRRLSAAEKKTRAVEHLWDLVAAKKRAAAKLQPWELIEHHDRPAPAQSKPSDIPQTKDHPAFGIHGRRERVGN